MSEAKQILDQVEEASVGVTELLKGVEMAGVQYYDQLKRAAELLHPTNSKASDYFAKAALTVSKHMTAVNRAMGIEQKNVTSTPYYLKHGS